MLKSAKPSRRSCAIDERKYDFIGFNLKKLRSALATVTGNVQNRIHSLPSSGIDDKISHDKIRPKISLSDPHLILSEQIHDGITKLLKQNLLLIH